MNVQTVAVEELFGAFDANDLEVLEVAQGTDVPGATIVADGSSSSSSSCSSCC